MKMEDIRRNYEALKLAHKGDQVSLLMMPGEHGELWSKVVCSPPIQYRGIDEIKEIVEDLREKDPCISKYDRFIPSQDAHDLAKLIEEDSEGQLSTEALLLYLVRPDLR